MELRYPRAAWKPLGTQSEPVIGVPRIFIVHTMVGYLRGTDAMFRRDAYTGTESTFGIGGPWDGDGLDGAVWQWQNLDRQADAQAYGNVYATSVETSDGGSALRPWSPAQVRSLILLGAWWARTTGNPARLVTSPDGKGFGYHRQFKEWNPNGHTCPGDVRLEQYLEEVLPGIVRYLAPVEPPFTLTRTLVVGATGTDVRQVQKLVGVTQDAIYGPITAAAVKRWQAGKGLVADGIFGPKSAVAAGWIYRG